MKRKYKRLAIIASFFTLCLAIMVGGIRVKEKNGISGNRFNGILFDKWDESVRFGNKNGIF